METKNIGTPRPCIPPVTKDPQVELFELKHAIRMFCFDFEFRAKNAATMTFFNDVTKSELYKEMKEKSK